MEIVAYISMANFSFILLGIIIAFVIFSIITFFLLEHFRMVWRLRRKERRGEIILRYKKRKKKLKEMREAVARQAKLENRAKHNEQRKGLGSA